MEMKLMNTVCSVEEVPNNQRVDVENSTADDTLLPEQPQPRVLHLMTLTETILHLMNTNIGSGLLAMGDAFKNGGLVFATLMTVFLGFICVHAQHQLLNCSTKMQKTRKMQELPNFAETVKQCFETGPVKIRWLATYLSYLVNIFIFVSQVGCSCVYIVFTANNLENVLDQYDLYCGGLRVNMMLITFIIMIICAIDSFKVMTHVSTCSLLLFVFGLGAVLYEAVQDLPPVSDRNYLAGWQQLPLYLGTAVYAFDAIGLVLPLKNEMKNPDIFQKRFGVLNISMTVLGSIFIAVGFLGYLKWGEDVQGSVTLNLQNKILSQVVQGVISVGILLTYPVQLYVPVKTIWPVVHEQWSIAKRRPLLVELMLKMLLILFTLLLAEVVPYLELVISLLGAVTATFLALILPPILETITEENCRWWLLFKNIFMVLLGLLIFLTGTYQSMCAIVEAFAM